MLLNHRASLCTTNASDSVSSVLRRPCTTPEICPLFYASCPVSFDSKLSTLNSLCFKSFKIRSSTKTICNPFRMRSFETQDLKSFRMRSYKKTGRGEGPHPCREFSARLRALCVSALSVLFLSPPLTTRYSLLTSPIFCLRLIFLLSSAPNRENAYVSK
jgi:hypothetical protein